MQSCRVHLRPSLQSQKQKRWSVLSSSLCRSCLVHFKLHVSRSLNSLYFFMLYPFDLSLIFWPSSTSPPFNRSPFPFVCLCRCVSLYMFMCICVCLCVCDGACGQCLQDTSQYVLSELAALETEQKHIDSRAAVVERRLRNLMETGIFIYV